MRCATRLINCWNFLFHYQSWLQHVLSPALSARLSVVNLDFIFYFLSFASLLFVSFFRKVNNTRSSLTSLPSSKPLIILFYLSPSKINCSEGTTKPFPCSPCLRGREEHLKSVVWVKKTPVTSCTAIPAPTYSIHMQLLSCHVFLGKTPTYNEWNTTISVHTLRLGIKKWMLFLSYCVSEFVTSVDADVLWQVAMMKINTGCG